MRTLILALYSVAALSAAMPTPAQEKEVMAAMDAWIQATVKQDIPALQRILHDELWYSHSAGTFQTKAEVINDVKEGRGPVGVELSDTRVRIYGNMAHVKSMSIMRNRPRSPSQTAAGPGGKANLGGRGNPGPSPLLVMYILVNGPQGWQLVSRQATRLTPPPASTTATP
jgi:Domain of unknown function (DUF4440)